MAKVKVYRTVSGDTWDLIAFKIYGSEGYFHDLIRSNLRLMPIFLLLFLKSLMKKMITMSVCRLGKEVNRSGFC